MVLIVDVKGKLRTEATAGVLFLWVFAWLMVKISLILQSLRMMCVKVEWTKQQEYTLHSTICNRELKCNAPVVYTT